MIGVILSSKFIESTLRAQFGEILPIELPIQNKPLLKHQIDSISTLCDSIYITIPNGYRIEINNEISIIEFEQNLNLVQVLIELTNCFEENEKIFIYYGDSLFLDIGTIDNLQNYYFVQAPLHQYSWGLPHESDLVPAGGIIISIKELKNCLIGCSDFETLSKNIHLNNNISLFSDFKWLDFGHTLTYYNSRKTFLESRSFNKLKHLDGFIEKSSEDYLKMWSEYNWLKECKLKLPANIPFVTGFNINNRVASYSIEYINHPALSDIFVFGKLPNHFFLKILESIRKTIIKIKEIKFSIDNEISSNLLVDKLVERQVDITSIAGRLNVESANIEKIISENINYFKTRKLHFSPMHGDLCFSNILFDFSLFEPILIDPRGYVSGEQGFSMYGPEYYDYYKLAHSYVVGYDFLIAGKENDMFLSKENMSTRLQIFCELFNVDHSDIKMGLINLFLTMLPLHADSEVRQIAFLRVLKKIEQL